ncbi:MAG: hypothetical protein ABI625_00905 [bacterium]
MLVLAACAPAQVETAQSPVEGVTRTTETLAGEFGRTDFRRGDDGTVVAKVLAPTPAVWDAVLAAMTLRKVTPTILNRAAGRVGDTSMVLLRKWNGHQLSHYFNCGSTITGPRADEERVRAVLLAQLTRLTGDTIAVAVHFSGGATPINSGSSGTPAQCTSTGRAESELLDEVIQRTGGNGRRM